MAHIPAFKKTHLSHLVTLVLASLALPPALAAEDAPAAADKPAEKQAAKLDLVEVTGVRATLKRNLAEKRESLNIVDSIRAEDVGKFPDKNVADSLQRVPGISVDRGWGEGKAIFVRGTDKNLNMTQMNGQAVSSSEWWLNEPQTRSFNYDMLPSEIVGSLDVFKSPSADLDEGSIGGLVNVKTRKPLDFKERLTVQGAVEAVYSKLPGKTDPQLSGLLNWQSEDKSLGVMLAVNQQKRTMRRDGLEMFADGKYNIVDQNGVNTPAYAAWGGGSAIFRQDRERTTANLALQFRPNANTDLLLNYMNSDMKMNNNNQNYLWQAGGLAVNGNIAVTDPKFITTSDGSKALVGGILGPKTGVSFEPIYRQSYVKSDVLDLDASYQGATWRAHGQVGTTTSSGGSLHDYHFWMEGDTRSQIDMGQDRYGVKYLDISPLDPKALSLKGGDDRIRKMQGKENYVQGDVTFDFDNAFINAVKVGAKFRDNTLQNTRIQGTAGPGSPGWQSFSLADLSTGPSPLLSQQAASPGALTQYAWYDDGLVASKAIPMYEKAMSYKDVLSENYKIREKISAAYVKAEYGSGKLRGDFGLRLVKTQQTSEGYALAGASYAPTSMSNNYSDALPNFNLVYDLSKEVIVRGAVSRAMARQSFDLLNPGMVRDGTVLSKATAGNPQLKPIHSNQAELGAEWYFADASLLSATVFIKKLDTFTYKSAKSELINGETLTVTRPYNADNGADIKGFELQWQQAFGNSGFGSVLNYTYTDAKAGAVAGQPRLQVLGNSRDQFNLSGYYEKNGIALRLSYNYRSKSYGNLNMGGQDVNSAYGQWDATANWDITPKLSLYASAVNVSNELVRTNTSDGLPIGVYENGARYGLGLRAKF
ncbi:iron complex outermembrane receptor protein [Paucibacter oligotrophus]|uniref:Iron complex outermembrane receptor protein n=1 Tax=Roseateles oligotrophus TaxID=1769250 RepID=A0A840L2Y5_9BURK|nr:iron complex outermembrane receptor protein [Roseateles oligotrophus]